MNKEIVSIIIPVYNVEKYIENCIESIVNQTYKNIEIILVDDGSTDKSGSICDKFSKIDNRISVIHKTNGGLSSARNNGLKVCNGKYVTFIDSDDWIKKDFVETMLSIAINSSADLVISGLISKTNYDFIDDNNNNDYKEINRIQAIECCLYGEKGIDVSACGKLYSKKLFENIVFPEKKLYEDFLIFDEIINASNKIMLTSYCGYFYLQRQGSIMNSSYNDSRYILISKSEELIKKYKNTLFNATVYRYVVNNYLFLKMVLNDKKHLNELNMFRQNILRYKNNILSNSRVPFKMKIATILLALNINLYIFFRKIGKRRG